MRYQDFVTHVTDLAWRTGDVRFAANIDNLITMANAAMTRKLTEYEATTTSTLSPHTTQVALPATYNGMVGVVLDDPDTPVTLRQITMDHYTSLLSQGMDNYLPYYTIADKQLMLLGPYGTDFEDGNGKQITVAHYIKAPDFKTTDTSFVADQFLDAYTYAALMQASIFLREPQNVAQYKQLFDATMNEEMEHSKWNKEHGTKAGTPLPGGYQTVTRNVNWRNEL